MQRSTKRMVLGVASLFVWVGILYAGLWPLNFHPPNNVAWLGHRNGIHFGQNAIVYSKMPLNGQNTSENTFASGALTVEIALQPIHEQPKHLGSILSFFDNKRGTTLELDQWESIGLVQTRMTRGGRDIGRAHRGAVNILQPGPARFLTVTSGSSGLRFYLNGKLTTSMPNNRIVTQNLTGRIILGNSATGGQGWTGNVFFLAIFNRALDPAEIALDYGAWNSRSQVCRKRQGEVACYPFSERHGRLVADPRNPDATLLVPPYFEHLKKRVLAAPWSQRLWTRSELRDMFLNIVAFIPLGFLLSAFFYDLKPGWHGRAYLLAILLGFATSLAIELTQVYLPMRDSSSLDLLCNTAGVCLGVVPFAKGFFGFRWMKPVPSSLAASSEATHKPSQHA